MFRRNFLLMFPSTEFFLHMFLSIFAYFVFFFELFFVHFWFVKENFGFCSGIFGCSFPHTYARPLCLNLPLGTDKD